MHVQSQLLVRKRTHGNTHAGMILKHIACIALIHVMTHNEHAQVNACTLQCEDMLCNKALFWADMMNRTHMIG